MGRGIEPFGEAIDVLFEEYKAGERSFPPIAYQGVLMFADRCELLFQKNFVDEIFYQSGIECELYEVDRLDYEAFMSL